MILPTSTIANFVLIFLINGNEDFKTFDIRENKTQIIIILNKSENYNEKYKNGIKWENKNGMKPLDEFRF